MAGQNVHDPVGAIATQVAVIPIRLNLASYLLDARIPEGQGDRIAIRCGERTFSYADVARRSAQITHLLVADDIRPEERVIVALPDGVDFAPAFPRGWGLAWAGALGADFGAMLANSFLAFACGVVCLIFVSASSVTCRIWASVGR